MLLTLPASFHAEQAAIIKHAKLFAMGAAYARAFGVRASDRIYSCLPLYHSYAQPCSMPLLEQYLVQPSDAPHMLCNCGAAAT